jgi:hypothetical protein
MSNPGTLVPPEVEAVTNSHKRWGVAFGNRFFVLLLLGLVWIIPAFVDLRFVYALALWDGLVLLAWLADLAQLPKPSQLRVRRTWRSAVALSIPSNIDLTLINSSGKVVHATIVDTVPAQLGNEPPTLSMKAAAKSEATAGYRIIQCNGETRSWAIVMCVTKAACTSRKDGFELPYHRLYGFIQIWRTPSGTRFTCCAAARSP